LKLGQGPGKGGADEGYSCCAIVDAQMDKSQCRRFEGKVALITAATAGIGLGIAHRLGEEGAKLVICSRRQVSAAGLA